MGEIRPVSTNTIDITVQLMLGYFDFYQIEPPSIDKLRNLVSELTHKENPSTQFLAYDDDIALGFVTLYEVYSTLTAGKVMLMNDLYVKPNYRGKGFGKALFRKAVDYVKKNGYPKMEWMTEPSNYPARKFYDQMGGDPAEWIYYSISTESNN